MHAPAHELAHRTAATAGPFAANLAFDCSQIAMAMRQGAVGEALRCFEATADRLQRFLTFVVVSSELVGRASPALGAVIADYGRRVLEQLGRIEGALDRRDLVGLTLALQHGLAPALDQYRGYADEVTRALRPSELAA
jgi:hypothetical protein